MGENKGQGVKGPRHDDDIDDLNASSQQQGSMQSERQSGNMQSGQQQGSQQSGGQHASGGTPALDDLDSRHGESAKDASQAWSQDNSADKQRGNR